MAYAQPTFEERNYIEMRLKQGDSQNRIARDMNRSQSTISRELARNTGLCGYRHAQANRAAKQRHSAKPKAIKMARELAGHIDLMLQQQWSPEQIGGRLKRAGGQLYLNLRHHAKKYRKRYGSITGSRKSIPNRVDIDGRPEVTNRRERLGDREADTMIGQGHKGALVTLDERKSKLGLALPVANKTAKEVTYGIITLLGVFKDWGHTLTFDNGKEFVRHEEVANTLGCETYFAKPYHSWERGQNENANGLLRQYFPKTMGLLDVTTQQVLDAVHKLNSRPRKCLEFRTPYEVFLELSGTNAQKLVGYALIT